MIGLDLSGATTILLLTLAVSLMGLYRKPEIIDRCLFRPYFFLRRNQYATIITSGFVHANLGHLLLNSFTFFFFAFSMEDMIGTFSFVVLYVFGLVLSHSCTYFKHHNNPQYASLGASGAISAVLFAYVMYEPLSELYIMPIPFPIPAALFAVAYVGYSYWAARESRDYINHDAHLCGALAGIAFVGITDPAAIGELFRVLG